MIPRERLMGQSRGAGGGGGGGGEEKYACTQPLFIGKSHTLVIDEGSDWCGVGCQHLMN